MMIMTMESSADGVAGTITAGADKKEAQNLEMNPKELAA
jgi:hypothetical protein